MGRLVSSADCILELVLWVMRFPNRTVDVNIAQSSLMPPKQTLGWHTQDQSELKLMGFVFAGSSLPALRDSLVAKLIHPILDFQI